MSLPVIYLIPSVIDENALHTIPIYIIDAVMECKVIFAENERTTRRFLKSLKKEIVIDNFEWFTIHKAETDQIKVFRQKIEAGLSVAIISEAGCPGIADPGQILVEVAQQMSVTVKPLVGPSSILLALMASGMNGQQFRFYGYMPIDNAEKSKKIRELEADSIKMNSTQIFIETPYRNNQIFETILNVCAPNTRVCVAAELTSANEFVKTKKVSEWKNKKLDLHKKLVIFLIYAGN